jgi:hypothetical protein
MFYLVEEHKLLSAAKAFHVPCYNSEKEMPMLE